MEEPWGHDAQLDKPVKTPVRSHLNEVPSGVKVIETERMAVPRAGEGELLFKGDRVSVLQDGRGDGCAI